MADISKCFKGCELQDNCYRWVVAPNNFWQSYADFKPDPVTNECQHYWPIKEDTSK